MKKERGITLIALIITIIILLILAMVTIRILMNQGIIKHAQNATEAYNDAQNNETEYLTYAEGEMDKYAGTNGSGSGGDTYTPPAEDLDALRRYFLGTKEDGSINEEGQSLMNVLDMEKSTEENFVFIDDVATIGAGSNVSLISGHITFKNEQQYYYYYIKYKNKDAYRLVLDSTSFAVKDVVFVYHPHGVEGETRTYNGEQWTVLYDKGTTLELVSPKTIGTYTLGKNDPNTTESTDIEKAIDSYNNAVTRLNSYCRTTLGDDTARCVGSNPTNPDSDNPSRYTSKNLANWADGTYNNKGKIEDENWEQDFARMTYYGVAMAQDLEGNDTGYYFASRETGETESRTSFRIRYYMGYILASGVWNVTDEGATGLKVECPIRAIVTVQK